MDEACSQLMPLVRRSLAPRGQTPLLLHSKRPNDKVSLMGALTLSPSRGRLGFYCSTLPKESFDDWSTAWFLKQLLRHQRGNVMVVWDRGPIHRGPEVRALLAKYPRLEIVELPAYAPELNPVEFVWSYLKYGRLSNLGAESVSALDQVLHDELDILRNDQHLLEQLWHRSLLPWPDRLLAS